MDARTRRPRFERDGLPGFADGAVPGHTPVGCSQLDRSGACEGTIILSAGQDEIQDVYREEGAVTLASLKRQVALEHAVRECERLHPPLIMLIRKVLKPVRYGDHIVPAGTLAMVSPAVSHRLPHVFADPERFSPERFDPPACEDKQHQYALIGFGGGKHVCMGNILLPATESIWTVLLDALILSRHGVSRPELRELGDGSQGTVPAPLLSPLASELCPMSDATVRCYDVVIVGAGPVGSLCALAHARKGARVALLEANPEASKRMAGEWLHPPAVRMLREVGINLDTQPRSTIGKGFVVFPEDGSSRSSFLIRKDFTVWRASMRAIVSKLREAIRDEASVDFLPYRAGPRGRRRAGHVSLTAPLNRYCRRMSAPTPGLHRASILGLSIKTEDLLADGGDHIERGGLPLEGYGHVFCGGRVPSHDRMAEGLRPIIVDVPSERLGTRDRVGFLWTRMPGSCRKLSGLYLSRRCGRGNTRPRPMN